MLKIVEKFEKNQKDNKKNLKKNLRKIEGKFKKLRNKETLKWLKEYYQNFENLQKFRKNYGNSNKIWKRKKICEEQKFMNFPEKFLRWVLMIINFPLINKKWF